MSLWTKCLCGFVSIQWNSMSPSCHYKTVSHVTAHACGRFSYQLCETQSSTESTKCLHSFDKVTRCQDRFLSCKQKRKVNMSRYRKEFWDAGIIMCVGMTAVCSVFLHDQWFQTADGRRSFNTLQIDVQTALD